MRHPLPFAAPLAPALRTIPFLRLGNDPRTIVLSDAQRAELARIGTRVRLPARTSIYRQDSAAQWVFAIAEGAVKSYRDLPSGKRVVSAFLFSQDLFGLARHGRYVNAVQSVTTVTLYRLPIGELTVLLRHDADLQLQFLAKVTHELREAQRRTIIVNRRDAPGRLAMFLALIRERVGRTAGAEGDICLPMTRSDIACFLGLSLESVTRGAAVLERRGLVAFPSRHLARILDEARFATLVGAV